MKVLLLIIMASFSLGAFAIPETQCDGRIGGKIVSVDIERGYPGQMFRYIEISVVENGMRQRENVTASVWAPPRFSQVRFSAPGMNLEIDFWPDQRPQWGRTYRGTLHSSLLENRLVSLFCRYR